MTKKTATKPVRRFARMPAEKHVPAAAIPASATPRAESKIALVTRLLERSDGASLDELVVATGWLPHTTRAALTGLKKKGTRSLSPRSSTSPATQSPRLPQRDPDRC